MDQRRERLLGIGPRPAEVQFQQLGISQPAERPELVEHLELAQGALGRSPRHQMTLAGLSSNRSHQGTGREALGAFRNWRKNAPRRRN